LVSEQLARYDEHLTWKGRVRYRMLRFMGVPERIVADTIQAKNVAVVGNASSLLDKQFGSSIDECDVVVRLNRGLIVDRESQGSRTDIFAATAKVSGAVVREHFNPDLIVWLSPYAKVPKFPLGLVRKTYFTDLDSWNHAYELIDCRARPSTGFLMVALLRRLGGYRSIRLFGFDFFETPNFRTGDRASDVHDFDMERKVIEKWTRETGGGPRVSVPA